MTHLKVAAKIFVYGLVMAAPLLFVLWAEAVNGRPSTMKSIRSWWFSWRLLNQLRDQVYPDMHPIERVIDRGDMAWRALELRWRNRR